MKSVQMLMMNKIDEGEGYGYLYNWYAVGDAKFAPTDWKVPTETEYETLKTTVSSSSNALRETGNDHWNNSNGTDLYGFKAFGHGFRSYSDGIFSGLKSIAYIWTSTNVDTDRAKCYYIISTNTTFLGPANLNKPYGFAVRLLYTGAGTPTTMTDYDGNIYDVVLIGSQRWIVQNWKCTKLNDGTPLTKVTDNAAWVALTTEGYCAYDNDENNV